MNAELLITLVEEKRCLWCVKDIHYKNAPFREKVWREIAGQLNEDRKYRNI